GEGPEVLAGRQGDQISLLLLLGAVEVKGRRAQRGVCLHREAHRGVATADLLKGQAIGEEVAARTTILFWERQAEQPQIAHLAHDRVGKLAGVVQLLRVGLDLSLGEVAAEVANHLLLGAERKVHARLLWCSSSWPARTRRHRAHGWSAGAVARVHHRKIIPQNVFRTAGDLTKKWQETCGSRLVTVGNGPFGASRRGRVLY